MKISRVIGLSLIALSLGGVCQLALPTVRLESMFYLSSLKTAYATAGKEEKPLPASAPVIFNPLIDADGKPIEPADTNFSVIVPKIGINAKVIPAVNPGDTKAYEEALKTGVAHASTSFFPNEEGTVYLFSHSTNYDWFVKDVNAVFYLLKNLELNDQIVLVYKGTRYTYRLTDKRVVAPTDISYLTPIEGKRNLILQTCWPPGSTTERLLILADLIDEAKLN